MKEIKIENARMVLRDGKEYTIIKPRIKVKNGEVRVTGLFERSAFADVNDFEAKLGMKTGRHVITESDLFSISGDNVLDKKIVITQLNFENVWFDELRFSMFCYGEIIETRPSEYKTDHTVLSLCLDGIDMIHSEISKVRIERFLNEQDYSYVKKYKTDFTNSTLEFNIDGKSY